jgi:hypothetical protein
MLHALAAAFDEYCPNTSDCMAVFESAINPTALDEYAALDSIDMR